jgi:hypothetical protein
VIFVIENSIKITEKSFLKEKLVGLQVKMAQATLVVT